MPPTDPVTLNGRVRLSEGTAPGRVPMFEDGAKQVYSIDARPIGEFIGTDLIDAYIQLEPDQPGGLGTIPLPQLDAGPYLSYGFQWLAFGIMGAARTGLLHSRGVARTSQGEGSSSSCRRFRSGRRRYRDDPRKRRCPRLPHPPPNRLVPSAVARSRSRNQLPLTAQEAKLADRYGNTR